MGQIEPTSPNQSFWRQCPGEIFEQIMGQISSVSKSNWLRDVIFRGFFINLKYIP